MGVNVLTKGGIFMIFIGLASVVGLAVIIERFFVFLKSGKDVKNFVLKTKDLLMAKRYDEAIRQADAIKVPIAPMIRTLIINRSKPREDLEKLAQAEAQKELPLLEARLSTLNTVGTIAPLLGLLGTVAGMIKAFSVIAAGNVADSALAGHISEALITTASGLVVAIPCMIMYNYYERRVETIVNDLEVYSVELIALLKDS